MVFSFLTVAVNGQEVQAQEQPRPDKSAEIIHPVPQVPIIVDGIEMPSVEISKFNGQELYYLVNKRATMEEVVYIFTTIDRIRDFTEKVDSQTSQQIETSCLAHSQFFSTTSYGGSLLGLFPGYGFTFVGSLSHWNNDIESTITTSKNVYTKLYDHTGWSGSQLWLATCGSTPTLGIYGWNNRAGSVSVDP